MFGLGSDRADALGRRLARLEQKVNPYKRRLYCDGDFAAAPRL